MNDHPASLTPEIDPQRIARLFDVEGLRVFIPGGYGALGEAIAFAFAGHGARVAIAGRNRAKADALAARIAVAGGTATAHALDARDIASVRETTREVIAAMDGIDVLVNCVGIQREQPLMEVTEETFDEVYRTNLKSAMFLAQETARDQIARGAGGRQIHLLSVRSALGLRGRGYSAYCATKGGSRCWCASTRWSSPRTTSPSTGSRRPSSSRIGSGPHLDRPEFRDFILDRNPLGRIGDPLEVAGQVIAFAAPAGSYITGQIVYIDGGVTASQ